MDDWLNSSVEIEVTEDGSILKIPDLALKSRHIVFSHSQKRPLTVNQPCFEVKIVQQGLLFYVNMSIHVYTKTHQGKLKSNPTVCYDYFNICSFLLSLS